MNRNKRAQLATQRSNAKQVIDQNIQALQNKGYGQGRGQGKPVDGEIVDVLIDYIGVLEDRVAGLEKAINLDVNPR